MRSSAALNQAQPLQFSLPDLCPISAAVESLALSGGSEIRGAVATRREVVDFILDLVKYTPDQPLHRRRLLEPAFGHGDFLLPAIGRLLASWKRSRSRGKVVEALKDCIRAVEIHRDTFQQTRFKVIETLVAQDVAPGAAEKLADTWLLNDDFLLTDLNGEFDTVVGNPPYVRQELIADVLLKVYRERYTTIYDRADLYIPFIERSLRILSAQGNLGFICADRWMKNRYGGPLRELVSKYFHLKIYVDMVNTPAFQSEVIAYPAITIISRVRTKNTRIARQPVIEAGYLQQLSRKLLSTKLSKQANGVRVLKDVATGAEPWILDTSDQLTLIRRLESEFPTLEEAGCKVGIGVATGADRAFIGPFEELDVEEDRKLPLVMTRDIEKGVVKWRGFGVINPFAEDSGLVDLNSYPRLKRYLNARKEQIAGRHCAQKAPANWYRTIDRITPDLARKPKLLIPDIKGSAHIVYERGRLYPHHNLYHVTSATWNLRALQAVLLSSLTRLFIETYSTKMRGGFLRFQAQYLRRLRLPRWEKVPKDLRRALSAAASKQDIAACNAATFELYGLTSDEKETVLKNGG